MAQIREFTIEGLAGRAQPYSTVLNPDVNVFFGLNGSGKTTLLKILHSALSTETDVLKDLPFTRAAVRVYLNRHRREFVRTYAPLVASSQKEVALQSPLPLSGVLSGLTGLEATEIYRGKRVLWDENLKTIVDAPKWVSDPPETLAGDLTTHRFGFLPISRLYRNVPTSGGKRLSDQELDGAFARSLQAQWSEYYADISLETAKAQERGLANILRFFLAGGEDQSQVSEAPDEKEAFKRISGFLERQAGFGHLLPNEKEFATIYARNRSCETW